MSQARGIARWRSFWKWHRRFGIVAALLVLILSLTGLALNHTESLRLDERFATAGWLLDWYGIEAPEQAVSHHADESRVALLGDRLYLDRQPIPGHYTRLSGAVAAGNFVALAVDDEVLIVTPDGQIVDRLGTESGVPAGLDGLGLGEDGSVVLRAGDAMYSAGIESLQWGSPGIEPARVNWSLPDPLPADELAVLQADFVSRVLPMERVVLDLHSGRLGGSFGVLLMDGAAILLLLLALTGSWMWLARRH